MREIKFRAWDNKEKQLIYNVHLDPDNWLQELIEEPQNGDVLMQYTGLKDKNGKEIYEGDIVKAGIPTEVVFKDGAFCVHRKGMPEGALVSDVGNSYPVEIIGNIYENPELLTPNTQ